MIKRTKTIVFLFLLNIVISNNNIKINYNYNQMKFGKKTTKTTNTTNTPNATNATNATNTKTNAIKMGTLKSKKDDKVKIVKNGEGERQANKKNEVIEVAREWVIKKEDEIEKETSIFINITNIARKKLENVSLKPNTVHLVIKYIMELIEDTPLKGVEQKELGLKVMRELFKDLTEGEDEIILLKLLDDGSISNIIDLVVDATNGKLNVNAVVNTSVQCITTCLPYCMRSKKKK